ncbi:MAG: 13E12 repeat family protein, partial [Humibacillus sp.]|nr:13E12 repeat family protein [Humibacillus sp.]MDN5777155.1 13E12 repeat family protein [Humibacillus sp.]
MIETDEGLTTQGLQALVTALSRLDEQVDDGERIDQLAGLERLKSAVAAAQARVTVGFVTSQEQIADGWREHAKACSDAGDFDGWRQARDHARRASLEEPEPAGQEPSEGKRSRKRPVVANGITAQVALARAESPHRGGEHVRLALALHRHLPSVLAWLKAGVLSEWRATLIVRECAVLSPDLQEVLDAELAGTLGEGVGRLGDRQLVRHVKAIAYRLDPESVLNRARKAEGDRRVSVRPAPDTMAYLTALLPVAQAVAAYAALTTAADTAKAGGDDRGRGQVMADTLVERVTGQETAEDVGACQLFCVSDLGHMGFTGRWSRARDRRARARSGRPS